VLAVSAMSTASLVAPTPGGLGVAEVTLVAVMAAGTDLASSNELLIAVSLFRLATWLLPIPVGAVSYLFWRRNTSWRRAQPGHGDPPAVAVAPAS